MVIKSLQLVSAVLLLGVFCIVGVVFKWTPMSPDSRRRGRVYFTHYLAKIMVKCIRINVVSNSKNSVMVGKLMVANHTSVLDAIILMARSPCVFVTSTEIEESLILGFLARTGGSIFIERRNRSRIDFDQEQIRKVLLQRFDVALFPEGTSTNGSEVLRFKAGLFPAATEIHAPIEPVSIYFESISGEKVSEKNRDRLYYYGDHQMHHHLFKIFTNGSVRVSVQGLNPVRGIEVKEVAAKCRDSIVQYLRAPLVSDRPYHFQFKRT